MPIEFDNDKNRYMSYFCVIHIVSSNYLTLSYPPMLIQFYIDVLGLVYLGWDKIPPPLIVLKSAKCMSETWTRHRIRATSQSVFICPKSRMETPEQSVKSALS